MELLEAYASPTPVSTPLLGSIGVGGCCPTWLALAGKWASSTTYGISILTVYQRMLNWLIPQRLVDAGLLARAQTGAGDPPTPPGTRPGRGRARRPITHRDHHHPRPRRRHRRHAPATAAPGYRARVAGL